MVAQKVGRNDLCPCGSGKKYKKCCQLENKVAKENTDPAVLSELQRGIACHQAGQLAQAKEIYQNVLQLAPNNIDALHYLGVLHYQTGASGIAVELINRAIDLGPTSWMYNNLGAALQAQGRHDLAVESYRAAIAMDPKYAEAFNNMGAALQELGRVSESVESYQRALTLIPGYAGAQNNLANALLVQGSLEDAIAHYRKSLALDINNLSTHSNLLLALSYFPKCTADEYLQEAKCYGKKVLAKASPYNHWAAVNPGNVPQKLRIGFVSADFKIHPVGYFLESMLRHINTDKLELVAYAAQRLEDALTHRIKPFFSNWRTIAGLSDESVARQIHQDNIHILVDLSGHTAGNRLAVFAWKAAPIQVSWLGYFASTGVPGIDYLLTDAVSSPAALNRYFTERFYYLPETRLCFTEPETSQPVGVLPALNRDFVTFACFQNLSKINDDVIDAWGQIFKALPNARLIIRNKQMSCQDALDQLSKRLAVAGIDKERIYIGGPLERTEYLAAYSEVDICLDTFPYPGGTTTCESLWMGVPVVTLMGTTLLSRQGASLLSCAGLNEWITEDKAGYISKAIRHAEDIEGLAKLRMRLRTQIQGTSLIDGEKFCRQLEAAFFDMWRQYDSAAGK